MKCNLCGKVREKERHVICRSCYKDYVFEAAQRLEKGEVISPTSWAIEKALGVLEKTRREFQEAREEFLQLQKTVGEQAFVFVNEKRQGRYVPKEVFSRVYEERKKSLWVERGGNKVFRQMKLLEARVNELEEFSGALEAKKNGG
ncbi:MAG: hypothetical protein PHN37_01350 [Candidatus Pacebacteria bacterium]|nr:hypothetical protein [Candidatus Paceibacterota bacterium]